MDDPIRNDLLKSSGSMKQEVNNEQISFVQVLTYCYGSKLQRKPRLW